MAPWSGFCPRSSGTACARCAAMNVHLSATIETASTVGARRGVPVVLRVDTAAMVAAGYQFRISANGVWRVDHVLPQ